jgi:prepilin-type N-terminal cleavage/methylation domain-containing protein
MKNLPPRLRPSGLGRLGGRALRAGARGLRRGFTLIELLAVILIISLLVAALTPMIGDAIESAEVSSCKQNLRNSYQGFLTYKDKYKTMPNESGVKFFAQLISREAIHNTKTNAERLKCPAVDVNSLAIGDLPWEEWWKNLDLIDGSYSSYAGRDVKEFPLRKFPGKGDEPLMGDDNDPEMNHTTATNVLYSDSSVQTYEIVLLREEGVVGPEEELLVVGPSSPVEDLRKLSLR